MTTIGGSAASVVAAVRDEVDVEIEKRQKKLDEEIASVLREATGPDLFASDRTAKLAEARENARMRLAQQDWLDSREALENRERWVLAAAAAGNQLLRDREAGAEGPDLLRTLAAEGLARLPGDTFEVIVSDPSAARIDDAWCRHLAQLCGKREVRVGESPADRPEGGCLVRTSDLRLSFDNSLEARARRLETAWRSALAELYG